RTRASGSAAPAGRHEVWFVREADLRSFSPAWTKLLLLPRRNATFKAFLDRSAAFTPLRSRSGRARKMPVAKLRRELKLRKSPSPMRFALTQIDCNYWDL